MKKTLSLLIFASTALALASCSNPTIKEYKVSFMSDGNPYGEPQLVKEGEKASKPSKDPFKEEDEQYYYTFKCWYDSNDETKSPFNFEETLVKQNYTLIAYFESIAKVYYTVSFDLNGGQGSFDSINVEQNKCVSKPSSKPTKQEDHDFRYTFDYWFDRDDETESEYNFNTPITHDLTLTAHYAKTPRIYHSVSFDVDGGHGEIPSQEIEEGNFASKPELIPTKESDHDHHYSFAYWYDLTDTTKSEFDFDTTPIMGDTTLKAKYNEEARIWHTVKFDVNGGQGSFNDIEVEDNKTINEPSIKPTKQEDHDFRYTFDYWFDSEDETQTKFDFTTSITSDLVLMAHYKAIERIYFTVSFDVNGGSGTFASQEVEQGSYATKPEGKPTKKSDHGHHYSFAYWCLDLENPTEFDFNTTINEDITLFAKYTEIARVYRNVYFDLNGGEGNVSTQEVEQGTCATKPQCIPTKEADYDYTYTFAYWCLDLENPTEFDFNTTINEDITLFAKYTETARVYFTVSFDSNGGTGTFPSQVIEKGYKAQKPSDVPTKTSELIDYEFAYWCLDLENPTEFDFNTQINANTVLYAYYFETEHIFNITWRNPNGDVLTTTQAKSGETPLYTFGVPYMANDVSKDEGYLFDHWYNVTDETEGISQITNHDVIYEAKYNANPIGDSMIVVEIPAESKEFHISSYNYPSETGTIDWGDGTINNQRSHTYASEGRYVIKVSGFTHVGLFYPVAEDVKGKVKMLRLGENVPNTDFFDWNNCNMECLILPYSCKSSIYKNTFQNCTIDTLFYYEGKTYSDFLSKQGILKVNNLVINTESNEDFPKFSFQYVPIETLTILGKATVVDDYTFMNNGNIKEINIKIPATRIGTQAFFNATKLYKVNIPSTVTSFGENAFAYCTSLTNLDIPSSVISIPSWCFRSSNIQKFNLTGVKTIADCAFGYSNMTYIKLSSGLETLHGNAFYSCNNLRTIDMSDIDGSNIPSTTLTKDFDSIHKDCVILVKDQKAYDAFVNDPNWKFAAHRLVIKS